MNIDDFIKNLGNYYRDTTVSYYDAKLKKNTMGFVGYVIKQFMEKNSDLNDKYSLIFKKIIERYPRRYKNSPGICEIKEIVKEIPEKRRIIEKIQDYFPKSEVRDLFKNRTKFR